jgi:hypothetical protein
MSIRANLISCAVIGAFAGALALALTTFVLLQLTPDWSSVKDWFLYLVVPTGGLLGMTAGIARVLSDAQKPVDAGYACLFGGAFIVWHFLFAALFSAGALFGLILFGLPLCLAVGLIWYGYMLCVEGGDRLTDTRLITAGIGGGVLGSFALALMMLLLGTWFFPGARELPYFSLSGMSNGWLLGAGLGLSWLFRADRRHIAAGCASLVVGAGVMWRLVAIFLFLWPQIPTSARALYIVLFGIPVLAACAVAAYGCTLLDAPKSAD